MQNGDARACATGYEIPYCLTDITYGVHETRSNLIVLQILTGEVHGRRLADQRVDLRLPHVGRGESRRSDLREKRFG